MNILHGKLFSFKDQLKYHVLQKNFWHPKPELMSLYLEAQQIFPLNYSVAYYIDI